MAYLLAPWGELGASATPRVRRLFTASYPTFGYTSKVQQGSLYPALYRLEKEGWLTAHWAETETGREAKFYALTRAGRRQLKKEVATWDRLSEAINLVVRGVSR